MRHLLAVSQELHSNGGAGRTLLMRYSRYEAWATLVSIPGDPAWAEHVLDTLDREERVTEIDGIGCQPVLIAASAEEMLDWIGQGLRCQKLALPKSNGPIRWPAVSINAVLQNQLR